MYAILGFKWAISSPRGVKGSEAWDNRNFLSCTES